MIRARSARWVHALAQGHRLRFVLTPGQAYDVKGFGPLFKMLADQVEALLADKPVMSLSKGVRR